MSDCFSAFSIVLGVYIIHKMAVSQALQEISFLTVFFFIKIQKGMLWIQRILAGEIVIRRCMDCSFYEIIIVNA